jgi:hypothetical protein
MPQDIETLGTSMSREGLFVTPKDRERIVRRFADHGKALTDSQYLFGVTGNNNAVTLETAIDSPKIYTLIGQAGGVQHRFLRDLVFAETEVRQIPRSILCASPSFTGNPRSLYDGNVVFNSSLDIWEHVDD